MKKSSRKLAIFFALCFGMSSVYAINSGPIPKNPPDSYKLYKCLQAAKDDVAKQAACHKAFSKK